jgi:predicted RNA-binding protein with PUA domain
MPLDNQIPPVKEVRVLTVCTVCVVCVPGCAQVDGQKIDNILLTQPADPTCRARKL